MKHREKKPRFVRLAGWLLPTLVGPVLGACSFVVVHALFAGVALTSALFELAAVSVMAAVLGTVLALVDFALLATRLRAPPTSGRAWLSSMAAGAIAVVLWRLLRPALLSAPSSHLWAVGLALLLSAVLVRWMTSPKPSRWFRFS